MSAFRSRLDGRSAEHVTAGVGFGDAPELERLDEDLPGLRGVDGPTPEGLFDGDEELAGQGSFDGDLDAGFGEEDLMDGTGPHPAGGNRRRAHAVTAGAAGLAVALALMLHSLAQGPAGTPRTAAVTAPSAPRAGADAATAALSAVRRRRAHGVGNRARGARGHQGPRRPVVREPILPPGPRPSGAEVVPPEHALATGADARPLGEFGFER